VIITIYGQRKKIQGKANPDLAELGPPRVGHPIDALHDQEENRNLEHTRQEICQKARCTGAGAFVAVVDVGSDVAATRDG
jgi:hypothetical protein